ncbi:MAG: (Na+)-NQR maturation NqrM [Congregibacter sp.]
MIFVLTFLIMALIVAGMAVGAMAGRGPLKGSCGGLSAVGIEGKCDICGDDPSKCDERPTENATAPRTTFYDASK